MAIVIPKDDDTVRIYVKGASEVVLDRCVYRLTTDAGIEDLDQTEKDRIDSEVISTFARKAYRTLTLAYKDVPKDEFESKDTEDELTADWLENELILIGIFGI
jgi:magnesium-transporting ATPase (P-type)